MFSISGSLLWLWQITFGSLVKAFKKKPKVGVIVPQEESVYKTVFGYPETITTLEEMDCIHTRIHQNLDYVLAYNPEIPMELLIHLNTRYFSVITATRGLISGQAALAYCKIPLSAGEDFQPTFEKIVHTATVMLKTMERAKNDYATSEPVRLSVEAYPYWIKALSEFERMREVLLEVQHFALWVIQDRFPTSELYLPNINATLAEKQSNELEHEPTV